MCRAGDGEALPVSASRAMGDPDRISGIGTEGPKPGDLHDWLTSVPEIDVLQRLLDVQPLDEGDRRLKVVDLLAADAQLVALDGRLHLHLGVLDRLDRKSTRLNPSH